jgi:hypothetical protein
MRTKTTTKNFIFFKSEVCRWIARFGLSQWESYFEHRKEDFEAGVEFNWKDRISTYILSKDWGFGEVNDDNLKWDAIHECLHTLLEPMTQMARERTFDEEALRQANEEAVRKIIIGMKIIRNGRGKCP